MTDQNEKAISRCVAFMAKNPEMAVGRIASTLVGRGYSPDQITEAFTAVNYRSTPTTEEAKGGEA